MAYKEVQANHTSFGATAWFSAVHRVHSKALFSTRYMGSYTAVLEGGKLGRPDSAMHGPEAGSSCMSTGLFMDRRLITRQTFSSSTILTT